MNAVPFTGKKMSLRASGGIWAGPSERKALSAGQPTAPGSSGPWPGSAGPGPADSPWSELGEA